MIINFCKVVKLSNSILLDDDTSHDVRPSSILTNLGNESKNGYYFNSVNASTLRGDYISDYTNSIATADLISKASNALTSSNFGKNSLTQFI